MPNPARRSSDRREPPLSPANVAIFKPLKYAWKKAVSDWRCENDGETLTLLHLGPVLQNAMNSGMKKESIINGFRVCGLYPFNVENVDSSKCIAKASSSVPSVCSYIATESENVPINSSPAQLGTIFPTSNNSIEIIEDTLVMLISPLYVKKSVLIACTTINEAVESIGTAHLHRIMSTTDLTEDQQVIRSLYETLLKPFHYQIPQTIEILTLDGDPVALNDEQRETELVELSIDTLPMADTDLKTTGHLESIHLMCLTQEHRMIILRQR
ncbi:uncharacterized protein LOC135705812 [Ochlerotatus camptorhynchus]|uniref:uncharacterized protein LOC135705812 n=1 Tax=Ochlerotatus camptorhynchus TaxID=644619 RepID=UPI0031D9DD05